MWGKPDYRKFWLMGEAEACSAQSGPRDVFLSISDLENSVRKTMEMVKNWVLKGMWWWENLLKPQTYSPQHSLQPLLNFQCFGFHSWLQISYHVINPDLFITEHFQTMWSSF